MNAPTTSVRPTRAAMLAGIAAFGLSIAPGLCPTLMGQTADPIRGFVSEGYFWVAFPSGPAWTYWVEASSDFGSWEVLAGNIPGSGNPILVLDPESGLDQPGRFYRVGQYPGPIPGEPPGNPNPAQWAWVAPGTFSLGSANDAPARESDEGPPTVTSLTRGLWMGRQEVTQQQYRALTGTNPSWFSDDLSRPVENVTFIEATNYCALLTAQEQLVGRLPAGYGYRLPTEAEWEYACRAGSTGSFCFGEDPTGQRLGYYAWDFDNTGSTNAPAGFAFEINGRYYTTQPAGTRQPNAWGLYDLHGSVWEWCLDWYGSYANRATQDPTGPATGTARVIRGGSWNSGPASCRSANRSAAAPAGRSSGLGFRVVLAPSL